ncbi:MAG: hypothetical protein CMJ78_20730 [Planctomycetaceae bacterium]|nr:hypothetical protein [Planctomycetaceae bacterium]
MKRLALVLPAVGLMTFSLMATLTADEQKAESPIDISRCRIQLIDHVILASDRPGILEFVEPEEGDTVESGQMIAKLKDDVAKASFDTAAKRAENDVQIRYAKKAREVAEAELKMAVQTNDKLPNTVPLIEIERLRLAEEKGRLQIEQAEVEHLIAGLTSDEAKAQLETYSVDAPFTGKVTRVYKKRGEAVRQGDPILELVSTRRVKVEGYINIEHVWSVKPGTPVEVRLDIPDRDLPQEKRTFKGHISFVDVKVQPVTRQCRVWAEVVNEDNILRMGLNARMQIMPRKTVAKAK